MPDSSTASTHGESQHLSLPTTQHHAMCCLGHGVDADVVPNTWAYRELRRMYKHPLQSKVTVATYVTLSNPGGISRQGKSSSCPAEESP